MAPLVESMQTKKVRTYDDDMCDAQQEAESLSWIHYLGKENDLLLPQIHITAISIHNNSVHEENRQVSFHR